MYIRQPFRNSAYENICLDFLFNDSLTMKNNSSFENPLLV